MPVQVRLGLLAEREFRLLWLGRSLSSVGDALIPVALAFAVLDIGTASDLGIVLGAFMGARMLFVVAGGVWADRLPRRALMIAADLVRAIVQGALAVGFFADAIEVWHLVVASVLVGAAAAFFTPAATGLLPQVVSTSKLQEANALLGLSRNGAELFGPALSGALVATVGYGIVFAIDALSFLASLAFLAQMTSALRPPRERQTFLAEAREGLREVVRRRWVLTTLVSDALGNFAIAPYFVLGPLVAREQLGGATDWGLMMTAAAAGGIAGGLLTLRWRPRRPLVAGYVVLFAIPLALLTLVPPLPLPVLMLASAGFTFSIAVSNTFWSAMEQQEIPNEALGRVDSIAWMLALVIMPVGYVVTGPVADAIGVETTLLLAAAIGATSTTAVLASRSVRELERSDETVLPEGEAARARA